MQKLILILVFFTTACTGSNNWDVAVVLENKIEFLSENGSFVENSKHMFNKLNAITYNYVSKQILINNMNEKYDTIYGFQSSNTKKVDVILENLADDIVDMAIDPMTNVLYWIDSLHNKIKKFSLNNSGAQLEVLFEFKDEIPQGIAIDSCRRKLYWTNANHLNATIERSNLDGSDREVIVRGNLFMPFGIAIDQSSRRLYWTDLGEGIYFTIESARLDGSDRKIVYEDTHQQPFRIAVGENYIYWTDLTSDAIWGIKKDETGLKPDILKRFNEKPKGLVTRNHDFLNVPECQEVVQAINTTVLVSSVEDIVPANNSDYCLNFGEFTRYGCKCSRGYSGPRCEINLCHNLCVNGLCYQSSQGYPKCKCRIGFIGERCEIDLCTNFCMNNGICSLKVNDKFSTVWLDCKCPEGYSGSRCHIEDEDNCVC